MRGIAWSTLFGIVLALLVVFFAGVIILGIGPQSFADASLCSNTGAALRMFSYFDGVTVASPDDPTGIMELCPPRLVSIPERASDDRINKRIGDELVICQNSFGGGQVNLFRDEERGSLTRYCGLCSKIDFEEELPPQGNEIPIEGFEEHLATYVVPGTDRTIGQILNADLPQIEAVERYESGDVDEASESFNLDLVRGEDLAILYVYDKRASVARNGLEAFTYGALGTMGLSGRTNVGTGARFGRAIGARLIWPATVGRAAGTVFGPIGAFVVSGAVGGGAALFAEGLYTDDWIGGVVMVPWSVLSSYEVGVDGEGEQGLSTVLGCEIPVGFVEES